jgi:Ser/Thr protein kinase RdoA (MazF antagonist)
MIDEVVAAMGWPLGSTVTPLGEWHTAQTYRVEADGERFVVRCGASRGRVAATLAARHRVGPTVVRWLPDLDALVSDFVEGRHVEREDLGHPPLLEWTVEALRRFHAAGALPDDFDGAGAALADAVRTPPPPAFEAVRPVLERAALALAADPQARVPCHNDLGPSNIVVLADRVVLIDWEYAAMGDAAYDLAVLSVAGRFDDEADYCMLEHYYEADRPAVTPARWARLKLLKIAAAACEGMWNVVQGNRAPDRAEYGAYATNALGRAAALAADPHVPEWLAAVVR